MSVIVVCKDVTEDDCCCSIESERVVCTHGPFASEEEAKTWVTFETHRMFAEDSKCYYLHEVLTLNPPKPKYDKDEPIVVVTEGPDEDPWKYGCVECSHEKEEHGSEGCTGMNFGMGASDNMDVWEEPCDCGIEGPGLPQPEFDW